MKTESLNNSVSIVKALIGGALARTPTRFTLEDRRSQCHHLNWGHGVIQADDPGRSQ